MPSKATLRPKAKATAKPAEKPSAVAKSSTSAVVGSATTAKLTAKPKMPALVKVLDQPPTGTRRVELRQTGPQQYEVWKVEVSTWGGEVAAMRLAAGASLPVPRFLGQETITHPNFGCPMGCLRISYVPGNVLSNEWASMGSAARSGAVGDLSGFVRNMRARVAPPKGCEGWVCSAEGRAFNFPLDMGYDRPVNVGPFRSQSDFNKWLMSDLQAPFGNPAFKQTIAGFRPRLDALASTNPVVFTHGDLHMHNAMVRAGEVTVIDWGNAGFFPAWVEYVRFVDACQNRADRLGGDKGIRALANQIFGRSYENELTLWREMTKFMQ